MITVITGGSGSGKSAYAEECILSYGDGERIYIATMEPFGEEGKKRIARHHRLREGKGFTTIERYTNLDGLMIPRGSQVLLECMSNLVANEMFRPDGAKDRLLESVVSGVRHLEALSDHLCIVTNDISSEIQNYDEDTILYEKCLGKVNQELGRMACQVVEVTCGIPTLIKGGKPQL